MASGDLTASTPVYVDINDPVTIVSTVGDLNLAAVTDNIFIIPVPTQHKVAIFKVTREA